MRFFVIFVMNSIDIMFLDYNVEINNFINFFSTEVPVIRKYIFKDF